MPGLVNGRKRTLSPEDEDEDGRSQISQDLGSSAKRPRTNGYQDNQSPSRPVLPDSYRADSLTGRNGTSIPTQVHQPGSIRRVTMRNFVTYKEAEFLPGPSLNMVIGPNGTGKSTLVCAICLGLGWETKHLGRAKEIGEFVRHGCSKAVIEIELERDPERHDLHPVIKTVIKKTDNVVTYFLNGRSKPRKDIRAECRSFSIQVDNLCQFLPQDRVVEFAALNPIDLLSRTLQAAAPEEMSEQYDELKELHEQQNRFTQDQSTHTETLKNLESRHDAQRTDVERFRERANIQRRVNALDMYRPTLEYNTARVLWEEAKARQQTARRDLAQLESEVAPALESCHQKDAYVKSVRAVVQRRKALVTRAEKDSADQFQKQEDFINHIKEYQAQQEHEGKREKELKTVMSRIRNGISDIELKMQSAPPEFEASSFNDQLREFQRQNLVLEEKLEEIKEKQRDISIQIEQRNRRIVELEKNKEALRSKAGRQEAKLKQASSDTSRAWQWVQNHQDKFKDKVYGPPMVTCTVKDPRHANAVESAFGKSEFVALTVTNDEDFRTLQRELAGNQRLSDIYIRTSKMPLAHYQPSLPKERLNEMGLDGYILDLLEGPEAVLGMLCDGQKIHNTAYVTRRLSPSQIDDIRKSEVGTFVTPDEIYTTTRRKEYGEAGVSTRTRKARTATVFNDSAVDTGAENQIKTQILELRDEIATLKEQLDEHQQAIRQTKTQIEDTSRQAKAVQDRKNVLQTALAQFNGLPAKLSNEKDKLKAKRDDLQALSDRVRELDDKIQQATMNRGKETMRFVAGVDSLYKLHAKLFEAEIVLVEAESDLEALENKNVEVTSRLEEARQELERFEADRQEAKDNAMFWIGKVKAVQEKITDEEKAVHDELSEEYTLEDLQNELEGLQAQLESLHEGNANVVKEYEDRALRIEKTKEKLERLGRDLSVLERKIDNLRTDWEPKLDTLISQISDAFGDNFNRIGCAGEVQVSKVENFAEWSILIMVRFRENEPLSPLDSHRQSGGERAVMVHARMVDIACAEHTSQYFLITPKLLPNLKYDPRMKIHCIASGEHMPEDFKKLDFQQLANKALQLKLGGSAIRG
ncbi:AAA domain-containing protein 9 [Elsinoe fawcettii]|nr:AAA domain-containing protein 9 [Elsinoe fawcettii]